MKKYLYNLATDRSKGFIAEILKFFLFLLSLIYAFAIKILSSWHLRNAVRLKCKVISVGNITLGGTGKTTLVEYIAKFLKGEGKKIAILTRGYGKKCSRFALHATRYETMGDEPYMLADNLKDVTVLVDSERIRSAHRAIEDNCVDTVILDDGMQQWKIKKDMEIVTIDSLSVFGNGELIPRGILREPLSALKRADIFLLTKVNLNPQIEKIKNYLRQINPRAEIFSSAHQPVGFYELGKKEELLNPFVLKGKNVTLISGIGDPGSFEDLIVSLGINISLNFKFCDHYNYQQEDLEKIMQESKNNNIDTIVTTQKDAVRLAHLGFKNYGLRLMVMRIELKIIENEERFQSRLLKLYRA